MGRKSSHICPQLVGRGLLADPGTRAQVFRRKFRWNPRFEGEERFLQPTFQAEDPVHRPREFVAATNAGRLCILEIRSGEPTAPCD